MYLPFLLMLGGYLLNLDQCIRTRKPATVAEFIGLEFFSFLACKKYLFIPLGRFRELYPLQKISYSQPSHRKRDKI